ncbi:TetR/AcrR family transcriptional regulator [Halioglobus maricola]|uniref:TetR/AcrR family transcriptional regulator n=1 Tax=Halioglobus maricola TaxID=2601894 RepID=A0A5P9NKP0_9GAMM|nr:TetR/AcrR family transcriptional regulator [Halioglobus maricola]QFU76169.1 TetR/AcrR family transcriptional regulator [Halioglobus maricola]
MSQSNYHHGDLRNALILAAVELIEEKGSPDVAISEVAKRAGVSAAAPYRHFKDKEALLDAVSQLCFLGLGLQVIDVREKFEPGARECIISLGITYTRYVSERPAFYNMMWSEHSEKSEPLEETDGRRGFSNFADAVESWCIAKKLKRADPLDLAIKLWALAHGLAVLNINGQVDWFMPNADLEDMLVSSTNAFLDGVEKAG